MRRHLALTMLATAEDRGETEWMLWERVADPPTRSGKLLPLNYTDKRTAVSARKERLSLDAQDKTQLTCAHHDQTN
jgi:hypothetical protein